MLLTDPITIDTFSANVSHLLQQRMAKLVSHVSQDSHSGEAASVEDQFAPIEVEEMGGAFQTMQPATLPTSRRWIFPRAHHKPLLISDQQKIRLLTDPTSNMTESMAMAFARHFDDVIFDAYFADAMTGRGGATGYTTEQFDTTNYRVDGTAGLLTLSQIKDAQQLLLEAEVDLDYEKACIAMRPRQYRNLLDSLEVTSGDFTSDKPLDSGLVREKIGINFIVSNRVPNDGTYDLCPVWVPSGIHFGTFQPLKITQSIRHDLTDEPLQIYGKCTVGATRLQQGKVVQIRCATS